MKSLAVLSVLFVSATCLFIPNLIDGTFEPAFKVKPDINRIIAGFAQSPGAKENSNHKRIIGGSEVAENGAPYIVRIFSQGTIGRGLCGGTLISPSIVVTAAHCVYNLGGEPIPPQNITIGYGSVKLSEQLNVTAVAAIPHPDFVMPDTSSGRIENDIAILRIPKLTMDEKTSYISIYNRPIQTGDKPLALGWGVTTPIPEAKSISQTLKSVAVTVGDVETCNKHDPSYKSHDGDQICTLNKYNPENASCLGDSGTGLVIGCDGSYCLAGLTSEGGEDTEDFRCGAGDSFVMYTNVRTHLNFIEKATGVDGELFLGP